MSQQNATKKHLDRDMPEHAQFPVVRPLMTRHYGVPTRKAALSSEFVWALEKEVKRVVCQLHDHGADGCELQLVRDEEFSTSRQFAARAQALAHADALRTLLEGEGGWRPITAWDGVHDPNPEGCT